MVRLHRFLFCFAVFAAGAAGGAEIPVGGQVVDSGGRGLEGIRVGLEPIPPDFDRVDARLDGRVGPGPEVEATTDADGYFELAAPRLGAWKVVVAPGYGDRLGRYVAEEHLLRPLAGPTELPPVELQPAAVIEVKVLDEDGKPADARLGLSDARGWRDGWRTRLRLARSGEEGVARLALGAEEKPRLEVLGPSHPLVIFSGDEIPRSGSAEIRLPPGGVAGSAVVTDRRGGAVAGAVAYQGGGIVPLGRTDEEGRLSLVVAPPEHEPPGISFVTRDGYLGHFEPRFSPDAANEAEVLVEPLARVRGQVVDRERRDPVAGAVVWVAGGPVTETDVHGRYELRLYPRPYLTVQAVAEGYATAYEGMQLAGGDGEDGPTVALAPAATLSGSVVDPEGEPLAGVEIGVVAADATVFRSSGFRQEPPSTRSTRSGRFFLSGLPPSASYELEFRKRGFAPARYEVEGLEPFAERSGVVVVLDPGHSGAGWVVDESDAPVAGAEVRLVAVDSRDPRSVVYSVRSGEEDDAAASALTDAEGRFRLSHLAAGRYNLEVEAAGFAPFTVPGLSVDAASGEKDFGTVVLKPGARIEGVVRDPQGSPVAEAEIHVGRQSTGFFFGRPEPAAASDGSGRFVVADLEGGNAYDVVAKKKGYSSETATAVAGEGVTVEFVLRPTGTISGRVLNEDGDPVEGAMVHVEVKPMAVFRHGLRPTRTDDQGFFRLEDVEPGAVHLAVNAPGYQKYQLGDLEVPSRGEVSGVEIVLVRGATITGRVTRPDGTPAVQAMVTWAPAGETSFMGGGFQASTQTDGEGRFRLDGVAPGPAVVGASSGTSPQVSKHVEVRSGVQTVDLVLDAGFEVSGRVTDERGVPVAGAALTLRPTDANRTFYTVGAERPVVTGPDGTFTLKDVVPGHYLAAAAKEGYAQAATAEPFEVANGPVAGIELELRRGATLRGRILGVEIEDLAGVAVHAYGGAAGGSVQTGLVDFEGRYSVSNLAPGIWHVTARLERGGRQTSGMLKVEEGQAEAELDLEFKSGFPLEGVVRSAGRPEAGIHVSVNGLAMGLGHAQAVSGSDGRFSLRDLPAGKYRLTAMNAARRHSQEIEVPVDGEVVIDLGALSISGHVRDEVGERPMPGVSLRIESLDADTAAEAADPFSGAFRVSGSQTDSRGYFSLSVGEGRWRVIATKAGYGPAETIVDVRAGGTYDGVELRMSPTDGVTFDVLSETGVTPNQVLAAVLDPSGQALTHGYVPVGEGGTVRLTTVPAGSWELVVQAGDSAVVRTPITAPGHLGQIRLPRGGALQIRIPALEGQPQSFARDQLAQVRLVGPDGRPHYPLEPMGLGAGRPGGLWPVWNGVAMIQKLSPGVWSFTVSHPDGRSWTGEAAVAAGETSEVVVP